MNLFFFYTLLTVLIVCESRRFPKGFKAYYKIKVVRVISGDSLVVEQQNGTGKQVQVRLARIESPRLNQSYGIAAKNHLETLLTKNKGKIIGMRVRERWDDIRRNHVILYLGTRDINWKMVYDGFAWCDKGYRCWIGYRRAMRQAKIRKVGIWKDKNPTPPWQWKDEKLKKREAADKSEKRSIPVTLNKVVDGDTVYVTQRNSKDKTIIKVRMTGIDSPEMKQDFGPEAKNHLQTIFSNLSSSLLQLIIEGTDKYKRTLGVIMSGSVDVNKKMIEDGYAWCYRHTQCPKSYQSAMKKTQKNRKGLFVQNKPTTPWDWRKEQKM